MPGHNILNHLYDADFSIEDPGDGGDILLGEQAFGVCGLVSAGTETRSLPDPAGVGFRLVLQHRTDGGSVAVTAATAINEANNTTITFTDVDECIELVSVYDGASGGYRWCLPTASEVSLS